jgi:hypothetical protein
MGVTVRQKVKGKGKPWWIILFEGITLVADFAGLILITIYIWSTPNLLNYKETFYGIIGDFRPVANLINDLITSFNHINHMKIGFIILAFSQLIKIYLWVYSYLGKKRLDIAAERFIQI